MARYRKSSFRAGKRAGAKRVRRMMNRIVPMRMRLGYRM